MDTLYECEAPRIKPLKCHSHIEETGILSLESPPFMFTLKRTEPAPRFRRHPEAVLLDQSLAALARQLVRGERIQISNVSSVTKVTAPIFPIIVADVNRCWVLNVFVKRPDLKV